MCSQLVNDMSVLLFQVGLRYNERDIVPAQPSRGGAGPVSVLLRGWDSPAAFVSLLVSRGYSGSPAAPVAEAGLTNTLLPPGEHPILDRRIDGQGR